MARGICEEGSTGMTTVLRTNLVRFKEQKRENSIANIGGAPT